MKTQGFVTKIVSLSEIEQNKLDLPKELGLWGSIENFNKLKDAFYTPKVFLLYYFDEVKAGLVFLEHRYFNFLRVGHSPHPNQSVPYGHMFVKPQDSQRAHEQLLEILITELTDYIKKNFLSFRLILPVGFNDIREFLWNGWETQPRFTYYLPLEEVKKITLSIHVGKKIRNIIKMAKERLIIKQITPTEFYQCYHQTYHRQGMKTPKTQKFFEQLYTLGNVFFYGAFQEQNNLTAGIIVSEVDDTAYFVTSGAVDSFSNSNGVTYLLYNYFEELINNPGKSKIHYFDFVGANTKRLAYFKSSFQPKLMTYYSVSKAKYPVKFFKKVLGM